ncbi:MAG: AsnC family transcriptional regulator [Syntrophomonas sp.]|nr:AsnC family transcriptional regulator [Syntrophomonas sp.]
MMYDAIDRGIIALIQGDLPLKTRPFQKLAEELGISEQEIVERIQLWGQKGIMRRWGVVLRHQQAGYGSNAMVAWKAGLESADEAGRIMAGYKSISHCYLRQVPDSFPYNLFSMIHAQSEEQLMKIVDAAAQQTGLSEYIVIRSLKEFKKASMKYI